MIRSRALLLPGQLGRWRRRRGAAGAREMLRVAAAFAAAASAAAVAPQPQLAVPMGKDGTLSVSIGGSAWLRSSGAWMMFVHSHTQSLGISRGLFLLRECM